MSIYHQKKDYTLRIHFNGNSPSTIAGHYNDIQSIVVTCQLPDGTEYTVPISESFVTRSDFASAGTFTSWYGIVPNNETLTSQLGTCKLLVKVYDGSNTLMGSGRANLNVISSDSIPYKISDHPIDFWAGAIPTVIRVNQDDENLNFRFHPFHSKGTLTHESGQVYLEGTTCDGEQVTLRGTETYSGYGTTWYYSFTLPKEITSKLGVTVLQIRVYRYYYSYTTVYKNLYSSKILLVVEPNPRYVRRYSDGSYVQS